MSKTGHFGLLLAACLIAFWPGTPAAVAQALDDDSGTVAAADVDTFQSIVFDEISLTEDGVTAVDTAGIEYYYDFQQEAFVEGLSPDEEDDFRDNNDRIDLPPIEERATKKLKVKKFEKSVLVGYDEYVSGNIIAYGSVTVKGWVKGDVKSLNKRVLVTETGQVDGDIEAPAIIVKEGGEVLGKMFESGAPLDIDDIAGTISADGIVIVLSFTLVVLFFGFLIVVLMPRQLGNFSACLTDHRVKCYALGLLLIFLMPVVVILCIITLVGLLVVPLVPMVYAAAMLLGVVAFGGVLGRTFSVRFLGSARGLQFETFVGVSLLMMLWMVVAALLTPNSPIANGLGIAALVIAIIVTTYPICTGVGAGLLTRFGHRPYVSFDQRHQDDGPPPAPAPPPLHQPPPIIPPAPLTPEPPTPPQPEPPPRNDPGTGSSSQQL